MHPLSNSLLGLHDNRKDRDQIPSETIHAYPCFIDNDIDKSVHFITICIIIMFAFKRCMTLTPSAALQARGHLPHRTKASRCAQRSTVKVAIEDFPGLGIVPLGQTTALLPASIATERYHLVRKIDFCAPTSARMNSDIARTRLSSRMSRWVTIQ